MGLPTDGVRRRSAFSADIRRIVGFPSLYVPKLNRVWARVRAMVRARVGARVKARVRVSFISD